MGNKYQEYHSLKQSMLQLQSEMAGDMDLLNKIHDIVCKNKDFSRYNEKLIKKMLRVLQSIKALEPDVLLVQEDVFNPYHDDEVYQEYGKSKKSTSEHSHGKSFWDYLWKKIEELLKEYCSGYKELCEALSVQTKAVNQYNQKNFINRYDKRINEHSTAVMDLVDHTLREACGESESSVEEMTRREKIDKINSKYNQLSPNSNQNCM